MVPSPGRFGLVSLGIALGACAPAAPADPGFTEADRAAIEQVKDSATAMVQAGAIDFTRYVNLYYAEDAQLMPAGLPAAKGRQSIATLLGSFPPVSALDMTIIEIEGTSTSAWAHGTYTMTMNPPGAAPIQDTGKYVEVWKKQADGTWKSYRDSFNSDLPPPPPPPAPASGRPQG